VRARVVGPRWTLRAKWTLASLVVAVAPVVLVGLVVLRAQHEGLARAEKELETAVVDEAASGVLATLGQASDVAARVIALFSDTTLDADARARLIADVVARTPEVAGVAFFDGERRFVDAVAARGTDEGRLRAPPEGAKGFRVLRLSGGAIVPRWEAPLTGEVAGFVVVALTGDALAARLADVSLTRFGAAGRVVLVDETRAVLAPPGSALPGIFAASGTSMKSFSTELLLTTEYDGRVGTLRTMPAERWAVVVERPEGEVFAALTAERRAFTLAVAGAAALALLASVLSVRRALGPIAALGRLVDRYARRDFAARSGVTSGDELEDLGASLERMADDLAASEKEIAKRARIEEALRRYMPEEAARAAAEGDGAGVLALGGARRRVTVLFADVVAFTGFAERASPERAVAFLNELFTILSEIVFRHGGMVDKFIGDCIMAVFTAEDGASAALAAAEDMHAFVASNLPRWEKAYAFAVELGIGVSGGEVLMGNLGSAARMEYTVVGDAVNVAARLESLARPRQTLATREVVDACPGLSFTPLGAHALRGKAQPVEVFEVTP
jgi:class 3 adenylate cyclase